MWVPSVTAVKSASSWSFTARFSTTGTCLGWPNSSQERPSSKSHSLEAFRKIADEEVFITEIWGEKDCGLWLLLLLLLLLLLFFFFFFFPSFCFVETVVKWFFCPGGLCLKGGTPVLSQILLFLRSSSAKNDQMVPVELFSVKKLPVTFHKTDYLIKLPIEACSNPPCKWLVWPHVYCTLNNCGLGHCSVASSFQFFHIMFYRFEREKEFSALICTIEALLVLIHLSQKSPISVTAIIPPKHTGFTKELLDPGYKKDAKSGYSSALAAHSSRFNSSSCSPHSMRCTKRRLSEEHPVQHRQNSCQVCQSKF